MPLHLPYMSNWSKYERIDGEIEFDGVHYNYVKRKVTNDTLYLLCLPNKTKSELYSSFYDYAEKVNDIPSDKQDGTPVVKKGSLFTEYNQPIAAYQFVNDAVVTKQPTNRFASHLYDSFIDKNFPPPKAA